MKPSPESKPQKEIRPTEIYNEGDTVVLNTHWGPGYTFPANLNGRTVWYCRASVRGSIHLTRKETLRAALMTLAQWRGVITTDLIRQIGGYSRRNPAFY